MAAIVSDRALLRVARSAYVTLGQDVRRQREDAGISLRALARASGVDSSYLARIEAGLARPSLETMARLTIALGADLSTRLYPNTGPPIRDRHQAPIAEALVSIVHASWRPTLELAVRRPSRGWIDLALHHPQQAVLVATEIQSELRRLEQLLRWADEKAASMPSWDGWDRLGTPPSISRLLVVRETRATKAVASEFRRILRASYPGDPEDAIASLRRGESWPGPSMLWAVRDRASNRYRIEPRP